MPMAPTSMCGGPDSCGMNTLQSHAAVWLQYPTWLDCPETIALSQPRECYDIQPGGYRWLLIDRITGARVYHGIGPIEIVEQPILF